MINTLKTRLKNSFCSYDKNEILQILSLFNKDGSFRDVDYSDTTRGTWLTNRHLVHTKILAECNSDPEIKDKLLKTVDFYNGKRSNPYSECNTAHWILKYMTHHRDGFYSAVRMSSKDVKGGDSNGVDENDLINGENALDGFGGYGVCVYMRDGMEYDDIFPVLDWGCMPGTTTPDVELPLGLGVLSDTEFVGSVSDGFYGISAADFKKTYTYDGETVSFGGKKAYFFFDECVVHLGADLYSNSAKEFHTTYDQCLLNGDVQAVTYKNALYAVFYKAGSVEYNGQTVEADNACMVILNDKNLYSV